jgi:hypothetical protein
MYFYGGRFPEKNPNIYILIYIQKDATLHSLFYLETALHVSGGTITHHQERYLYRYMFRVVPEPIIRSANRGRAGTAFQLFYGSGR